MRQEKIDVGLKEAAKISSLVNLKGIKEEKMREELIKEVEDIYAINLEKHVV